MPLLPSLSLSCDNLSCNIWFCCGSPKDEPRKHDDSFRTNPDQPAPMQSAPQAPAPHYAQTAELVPPPQQVVTPVSAPKRHEPPPQPAWIPRPQQVVTTVSAPKRHEPPPQPAWIPSPPPPPPAAAAVPSKRYEPPPSPPVNVTSSQPSPLTRWPSRVPSKTYDGMLPAVSSPAQAAARAPASQYPPARQLHFDDTKPSVESYLQARQVYY